MLELLLIVAAVVGMYKIADADDQSTVIWTTVAIVACIGSLALPFPFIRVGIGLGLALAAMVGYKLIADR